MLQMLWLPYYTGAPPDVLACMYIFIKTSTIQSPIQALPAILIADVLQRPTKIVKPDRDK